MHRTASCPIILPFHFDSSSSYNSIVLSMPPVFCLSPWLLLSSLQVIWADIYDTFTTFIIINKMTGLNYCPLQNLSTTMLFKNPLKYLLSLLTMTSICFSSSNSNPHLDLHLHLILLMPLKTLCLIFKKFMNVLYRILNTYKISKPNIITPSINLSS